MEHRKRDENDTQLEEHSLPGTNQAGKGPGPCEKTDPEHDDTKNHDTPERPKPDTQD